MMKSENVYSGNEGTYNDRTTAGTAPANFIKRISWSSVFAGSLIAIVMMIALSLLGLGIGLGTVDPLEEANPAKGLGIGSAIWYVVTSLVSIYVGAWIAGRLARTPRLFDGLIHGLLTWSVVTLLTLYFFTSTIGSVLGSAGRLVGNTLGTVGTIAGAGATAAAPKIKEELGQIDLGNLKQEAEVLLRQTGKRELQPESLSREANRTENDARSTAANAGENPQQGDEAVGGLIDRIFKRGDTLSAAVDKEAVVNVIMARSGKSREEASQIADNWIASANQAKAKWQQTKQEAEAKARQVADDAASAASKAAILIFVSLLLSAGIALFGAKRGTESKEDVSRLDHKIQAR